MQGPFTKIATLRTLTRERKGSVHEKDCDQ